MENGESTRDPLPGRARKKQTRESFEAIVMSDWLTAFSYQTTGASKEGIEN